MKKTILIWIVVGFFFVAGRLLAQQHQQSNTKPVEKTRILFIMDASQSMLGKWQGEEKFVIARRLLSQVLDSIKQVKNIDVALRVYGNQKRYPPQDCNDTKLEVPFGNSNNIERIKYRLKHIHPKGTSPIAASLAKARFDFPNCNHCRNVVILITDGKEECGGDICEVSASLQKKGIILKPFIIGIGSDFRMSFDCAGTYFNAADKQQFSDALNLIITRVLSKTSLQVNLLDQYGKPTVSNVNLQFINKKTGTVKYNFVHTLNVRGLPDTLVVNPTPVYNIVVGTIPPTLINNVKIAKGRHNIVAVSCPQGSLTVKLKTNARVDFNPAVLIRNSNRKKLINVQYLQNTVNYLRGEYSIDILTLPVIHLDTFDILADKKNIITIDNPGIAVMQKNIRVFGSIFHLSGKKQEFVIRLNENNAQQKSFYLQPGHYRVVYRSRFQNQSVFTVTKDFTIQSGKTTRIRF